MKKQFQSKSVPRGTRTIWRYLGALFLILTFGIGQMWAADADYSSYDWDETEMNKVVGTHGSVVIDGVFKATGNVSSHYYLQLGDNLKYSDNPWKGYMSIASSAGAIDSIKIFYCPNGTNQTSVAWAAWGEGVSPTQKTLGHGVTAGTKSSKTWGNAVWEKIDLTAISAYTVYLSRSIREFQDKDGNTISNFGGAQSINVLGLKVWLHPDCNQPATALSLSSDAPATIYADTEITFSTSGGNGGSITIAGAASEDIQDNKWTATEGEHTFTASQPKTDGKCAQEAELKLTVLAATPVSAVTVNGPANGYKNNKVIFAATAANATQYRWTVDGVVQGSDSAKLHFTPTESKTYSIVCEAKNAFNSDWVASTAHSLTVTSLYGELIRYVVDGGTAAKDKTGVLVDVATPEVSLTPGTTANLVVDEVEYTGHKMDKGKYVGVKLTSGSFAVGDTVSFLITKATGSAKLYLYNTKEGTLRLDSINGSDQTGWVSFVLNQATTGVYLYRSNPDVKPYDQNPHVAAVSVKRPMPAKSVAYDVTAVKINGTAISAAELATLKTADAYLVDLMAGYAAAPVVKFARQTTTTYEDDSQKVANDTITVTASEVSNKWQAQATIGTITYTVKAAKQSSAKVYYYDGGTKIGEETVAIGGHPAEYEAKQSKNLAAFVGWYSDADLADGHLISDIAAEVISADKTVYGKWTYTYAQSVNIEKWVLDNTKTPNSDKTGALISLLGTRGFASNLAYVEKNLELDSLNDSKGTGRNYAYLGLKVKSGGKMLDFRLAKNSTVKVKFGNVGTTPLYAINGGEYSNMPIEEKVFTYIATGNDYISIKMADDDAVVFKQIMIDAEIQDVTLPEPTRHAVVLTKAGETEHGTLAVASPEEYNWLAEGAAVTLTVAADEGYYIESVKLNGEALTPSENVYSFAMPNATANVVATFAEIVPNNVTYKANNGGEDADILEENATEIAGCSFTYAGHKFNGWNTAPDGTGDAYEAGDAVLSPLTLYAQWREYFVITYKDGDDVLDTEDVFVGEAPVGIADPVKAMNIFQGWTLEASEDLVDVATLTAATTLFAKWEAIDACFYFEAKSVTESETISAEDEINTTYGGTLVAKTANISYETLGVLVAKSGDTYVTANLDYAMIEGTSIKVVLAAGGTGSRGVNLCIADQKSGSVMGMSWDASVAGEEKEFTYTLDANSTLKDKKTFSLYRTGNAYIKSIIVKDCAPQDYTVTYKDGENVLGTEQVYENAHPTAVGIATYKQGYVFQGWKETVDGAVKDLNDITITAAKDLYAEYTVIDCSGVGSKYQFQFKTDLTSGNLPVSNHADMSEHVDQSAGGAVFFTSSSAGQGKIVGDTAIQFTSTAAYLKVELGCTLAAGDRIRIRAYGNPIRVQVGTSYDSNKDLQIAKNDFDWKEITSAMEGVDDLYITRASNGNATLTYFEVYRPGKFDVSFNMMGHGTQIADIEDVVEGSKITAPTAPTDENYVFAGWYKENTLENEWNFANDVVIAATTLYAKWLDKSDATLKSLKYGTTDIALESNVYTYNVELSATAVVIPALTAVANSPLATPTVNDATAFDGEGHAVSTVTVTPAAGAAQVYTVNFSKAAGLPQLDVTANTLWNMANSADAAIDLSKEPYKCQDARLLLADVDGVNNNATFNAQALKIEGQHIGRTSNNVKHLAGRYVQFNVTVPGAVIVTFASNGSSNRTIRINDKKYAAGSDGENDYKTFATVVEPGSVEIMGMQGTSENKYVRISKIEFKAEADYQRTVNPSYLGTLCWTNNAVLGGATLYEFAGKDEYNKLVFDEVAENRLEAGKPYIFMPENGNTEIKLYNTDNEAALTEDQEPVNNMYGTIVGKTLNHIADADLYYFSSNHIWRVGDFNVDITVPAYYCYVDYPAVLAATTPAPAPAPGRRRVTMGVQGEQVVTGVENLNASEQPVKLLINGQIFILRGEKLFDATGRLVK